MTCNATHRSIASHLFIVHSHHIRALWEGLVNACFPWEALINSRARVTVGFFAMLGAVRSAVVIPRSSAATTQREKSSCNPKGLGRFSPVAVSQAT
ncbi:MAG: hypothetical protein JJU06_19845, partial [Ectothiorhodospiraceae bacterium]|nr:hypothetical protein [Ectothiorhodospiraceae bacterium]